MSRCVQEIVIVERRTIATDIMVHVISARRINWSVAAITFAAKALSACLEVVGKLLNLETF